MPIQYVPGGTEAESTVNLAMLLQGTKLKSTKLRTQNLMHHKPYPLLVIVVASCGMAPMARNMMLKKETPKMARDPVAVLSIPPNKDPIISDMMTT